MNQEIEDQIRSIEESRESNNIPIVPEDRIRSNRARELMSEFIARSWPGWLALGLATTWVGLGGGHLFTSEYFTQVTGTLGVGAVASAGRSVWLMTRAKDEYEYEEIGAGGFITFAFLLSGWAVIASPPAS